MLNSLNVKLISTGGTRDFIQSLGYECESVEEVTGYPSILGGRVKTLHPKVFGGILYRRDEEQDRKIIKSYAKKDKRIIIFQAIMIPLVTL